MLTKQGILIPDADSVWKPTSLVIAVGVGSFLVLSGLALGLGLGIGLHNDPQDLIVVTTNLTATTTATTTTTNGTTGQSIYFRFLSSLSVQYYNSSSN